MPKNKITKNELEQLLVKQVTSLSSDQKALWKQIAIVPEKWQEVDGYKECFWVVGIIGHKVIWYNDIEEGFNCSCYNKYGEIAESGAEQDELLWLLAKVLS